MRRKLRFSSRFGRFLARLFGAGAHVDGARQQLRAGGRAARPARRPAARRRRSGRSCRSCRRRAGPRPASAARRRRRRRIRRRRTRRCRRSCSCLAIARPATIIRPPSFRCERSAVALSIATSLGPSGKRPFDGLERVEAGRHDRGDERGCAAGGQSFAVAVEERRLGEDRAGRLRRRPAWRAPARASVR